MHTSPLLAEIGQYADQHAIVHGHFALRSTCAALLNGPLDAWGKPHCAKCLANLPSRSTSASARPARGLQGRQGRLLRRVSCVSIANGA